MSGKCYWEAGLDGHDELQKKYVNKDTELKDDKLPPENTFARIEISPKNMDYLKPDTWVFKIDENIKPNWWRKCFESIGFREFKKWKKRIYNSFNIKEARNPINPLKIKPPKTITEKHIELLREWASVWDSVGASVCASVWASVRASVWDSVWDSVRASVRNSVGASIRDSDGILVWDSVWASVWDSVWDSVWASVWAYIGSLFPKIKQWKYIDNTTEPFNKIKSYPFRSAVELWKQGLVPSFDGETWRIHGGKNMLVLWEGKLNE